MKNLLLIIFVVAITWCAKAQTCGVGGLTFASQADIDNFTTDYPGCTQILGDLLVTGDGITNLNGFSGVTSIDGSLQIFQTGVSNMTGLGALTKIGQDLSVMMCPSLTSLSGLSSLTEITAQLTVGETPLTNLSGMPLLTKLGSIFLNANQSIVNFTGLSGLTSIPGWIYLTYNPQLADMTGLGNLTSVGQITAIGSLQSFAGLTSLKTITGSLEVLTFLRSFNGLDSLETIGGTFELRTPGSFFLADMSGLNSLKSIGGDFVIANTDYLMSLNGLQKLTSVAGKISFDNNEGLQSLLGIENVDPESFINLEIGSSMQLNDCGVKSICNYLKEPSNPASIVDNQVGCSSREVVLASNGCLAAFPVGLVDFAGMQTPEGNKLVWTTSWESNNKGFVIERSDNARRFSQIGWVAGNSDSKAHLSYSFIDSQKTGLAYYRLKQMDWDETFTYSRIIAVSDGATQKPGYVYPNPARGHLVIGNDIGDKSYRLLNKQGVSVMESAILPNRTVDVSKLPNDLYFLEVGRDVIKVIVNND